MSNKRNAYRDYFIVMAQCQSQQSKEDDRHPRYSDETKLEHQTLKHNTWIRVKEDKKIKIQTFDRCAAAKFPHQTTFMRFLSYPSCRMKDPFT